MFPSLVVEIGVKISQWLIPEFPESQNLGRNIGPLIGFYMFALLNMVIFKYKCYTV